MQGFIKAAILALVFSSSAFAADKVTCRNNKAYLTVKRKIISVSTLIKRDIQPQIKKISKKRRLSTADKQRLRTLRNTLAKYQKYERSCAKPRVDTFTPTPTPTSTSEVIRPEPVSGMFTGNGLDPVSFTMKGLKHGVLVPVTCTVVSQEGDVIWNIQNCNGTVRPSSHRISNAKLTYRVTSSEGVASLESASIDIAFSQDGDLIGDELSLAPYRQRLSDIEVARLIRWANLGADFDQAMQINATSGLDGVLDFMFAPKSCPNIENEALALARSEFSRSWDFLPVYDNNGVQLGTSQFFTDIPADHDSWSMRSLSGYWLHHIRYGCDPLREKIALFWQNHFGVGADRLSIAGNTYQISQQAKAHIDLLRNTQPGNNGSKFTPLSTLISWSHGRDAAQLRNLNNENDYRGKTNENYARELLELFSMSPTDPITGASNYNESHIYALTYALTGYRFVNTVVNVPPVTMCCTKTSLSDICPAAGVGLKSCRTVTQRTVNTATFDPTRWNDLNRPQERLLFHGMPFAKYAVFKADAFSGDDNLTPYLLNEHPGSRRYFAYRLITAFATLNPTNEMVDAIAQMLVEDNWKIDRALRAILRSSSFFSKTTSREGLASNFEVLISTFRALSIPMTKTTFTNNQGNAETYNLYGSFQDLLTSSGYSIMTSPTVFGFRERGKVAGKKTHDGRVFLNQGYLIEKQRRMADYFSRLRVLKDYLGAGYPSLDAIGSIPTTDLKNPGAIIDRFLLRMAIRPSAEERALLLQYMNTAQTGQFGGANTQLALPWSTMPEADARQMLRLKIPGLIDLILEMKQGMVR